MTRKLEIEARLERSLRSQVKPPKLDGRFDAAVWSRIAAQEQQEQQARQRVEPPKPVRMPAWLVASNVVAAGVSLVLVAIFVSRSMSGVEVPELGMEVPSLSAATQASLLKMIGPIISGAAVLFGLRFTRFGRKLLAQLR